MRSGRCGISSFRRTIQAAEALRAVQQHVASLDIAVYDGWVDEIRHIGDGFIVMYSIEGDDDIEAHRFAIDESNLVTRIEMSEYDLAAHSSYDLSGSIPDLLSLIEEC